MEERKIHITEDDKFEFIKLWEDEDILYEITHDDYRNKNKRNAAIKRIAEEMTVNIDVSDVSKMMKNLRTQFLKEKRKVDDSKSTGKGTKVLYISNWKCYSSLHFLLPFTRPMPTDSNIFPAVEQQQRQLIIDDEDGNENEDADVDLLFEKTEDLTSRAPLKSPRVYGNKNTRRKRPFPQAALAQWKLSLNFCHGS